MSWLYNLYQTYENCAGRIGDKSEPFPLLPIGHTTKEGTHICITLDHNGNFKRAKVLDKEDARSIIPVSEKSAGRTSGEAPHPLADQLQYLAKEYKSYGGEKTSYYEGYRKQLVTWAKSGFATIEIRAVLNYISNNDIIDDLIKAKILYIGDDGKLLKKWIGDQKEKPTIFKQLQASQSQSDCFIRWDVEIPGDLESGLQWKKEVWQSWIDYYQSTKEIKDLCYACGNKSLLAEQHPKKILPGEANAKLISANDTSGFTFRGRFLDDSQACNVSYEVTQKAHNALTWLIRRQGTSNGVQSIVAWSIKGSDVPSLMPDTLSLVLGKEVMEMDDESVFNAGQNIGTEFRKLISGYKGLLGNTDNVIVMALDSMTSGRAAIKYYRELTGSEYLERVENWHTQCRWRQRYSKNKIFDGAPAPKDIAKAAYGSKVDDKLLKATIERLLPCILDKSPIPRDLIECCLNNLHRRQAFEFWEWEKNLGITCALYQYKHNEKDYKMALEEERNTKDYLYGRLLALAESIERIALTSAENRPTNAERLMQRFADKPFSTWRNIELALAPYKQRLKANRPGFLANREADLISVKNLFKSEDFCDDKKLTGEFLLGYDCQRSLLPPWKKAEENSNQDSNPM